MSQRCHTNLKSDNISGPYTALVIKEGENFSKIRTMWSGNRNVRMSVLPTFVSETCQSGRKRDKTRARYFCFENSSEMIANGNREM